ncbi:hypothetical protein SAMN05216223_10745 [Actinacidiphila yanglinensis]|uniref:Uncharacterized protein n=1 Tax=Actinacidiphila yanglinensis TaxID=310779 RepID=A0A1H6BMH3_9ACTN|nr:hypothetical protein [Actinacidiphila yanglinensis]SEG61919.1 hypothetical protein SAMN05216223_10745 [Actinacidiphila yanglinensis]
MSDDGRAGLPGPRRPEGPPGPRGTGGSGGVPVHPGVPAGRADWLTHDAAEALLSGRRPPLADAQAEGEAQRLALLLLAAAAGPASLDALDPLREEEALAAFRAARAARTDGPAVELPAVGAPSPCVPVAGRPAAGRPGPGVSLPEPVVVGRFAASRSCAERAVPARRARVGRSTRIVMAAAASVVVLGGVAVAVAAVTGQAGAREPVRPAGTSAPSTATPDRSGGPDAGVVGVTGHGAEAPGDAPDPGGPPPAPPAHGAAHGAERQLVAPSAHGNHEHGDGDQKKHLPRGRHRARGHSRVTPPGASH